MCESLETDLATILLEVTPPAGTETIAGVRFTQVVTTDRRLDLQLGHISLVRTRVVGGELPAEACLAPPAAQEVGVGEDGTLDAKVTLVPRERLLGLPNPSHSAQGEIDAQGAYSSGLAVPPGRYDIYVEPQRGDGICIRPPYLVLDSEIAAGDVTMNLQMPEPERLDVLVRFPGLIDQLSDWTLDVVDRASGRLLSNQVALSDPQAVEDALQYRARFAYVSVQGGTESSSELLRLTPPAGVTAPQVYFERTVLELFQDGMGVIDQLRSLPKPVSYTGRVNRQGTLEPASASVTLVARSLEATGTGVVTSFSRTVKTDDEGVFEVDLLPGEYLVQIDPVEEDLAQASVELSVASGSAVQAGKVLDAPLSPSLSGRLLSDSGRAVPMVPIEALAPPKEPTLDVIDAARGQVPPQPTARAATTAGDGRFTLIADPGTFHVVARPETTSGFPWALRLGVDVEPEEQTSVEPLHLSHPYVIEGKLLSQDVGPVPSALIRAYIFLRDGELTNQPELATSVVTVGEARVDEEGAFQLLLPNSIE